MTKIKKIKKSCNDDGWPNQRPPEGWTPEAKEGAKHAAALDISLSDFRRRRSDGGRVSPDYGSGQ